MLEDNNVIKKKKSARKSSEYDIKRIFFTHNIKDFTFLMKMDSWLILLKKIYLFEIIKCVYIVILSIIILNILK